MIITEEDYLKTMQEAYLDRQKRFTERESEVRKKGYFSGSRAGSCPRRLYFEYIKRRKARTEEEIPDNFLRLLEGQLHDQLLKDIFRRIASKKGMSISDGFFFSKKLRYKGDLIEIGGTLDFLADDVVYEFKSAEPERFLKYIDNPPKRYLWQVQCYLWLTDAEKGILVLKSNATGKIKFISIEADLDIQKKIKRKLVLIHNAQKKKKAPAPQIEFDECAFCPYHDLCFNLDQAHLNKKSRKLIKKFILGYKEQKGMRDKAEGTMNIMKQDMRDFMDKNKLSRAKIDKVGSLIIVQASRMRDDPDQLEELRRKGKLKQTKSSYSYLLVR